MFEIIFMTIAIIFCLTFIIQTVIIYLIRQELARIGFEIMELEMDDGFEPGKEVIQDNGDFEVYDPSEPEINSIIDMFLEGGEDER